MKRIIPIILVLVLFQLPPVSAQEAQIERLKEYSGKRFLQLHAGENSKDIELHWTQYLWTVNGKESKLPVLVYYDPASKLYWWLLRYTGITAEGWEKLAMKDWFTGLGEQMAAFRIGDARGDLIISTSKSKAATIYEAYEQIAGLLREHAQEYIKSADGTPTKFFHYAPDTITVNFSSFLDEAYSNCDPSQNYLCAGFEIIGVGFKDQAWEITVKDSNVPSSTVLLDENFKPTGIIKNDKFEAPEEAAAAPAE